MFEKGIVVTGIFIASTVLQLISQIIITRVFGASFELDVFLAAVAIPAIVVTVIYGTFNDAFLPLFGEKKTNDPEHADQYFFSHLISLSLLSFGVAIVLMLSANPISQLLYGSRGVVFVKDVAFQMRYLFMIIPVAVISTLLGTYAYAHKNFIRFPLAQLLGSLLNVIIILFLSQSIGIWALIMGFVGNILIQVLFLLPRSLLSQTPKFSNITPFLYAFLPLMIGSFALRSDTLIIRSYGSLLPEGYLVYLNLISKIFSVATGVLTIGIQVLLLPHLVKFLSEKKVSQAIAYVNKAKILGLFISIVIIIAITLLSPLIIQLLFVGGKFTAKDATTASSMIPLFILPAIAWGTNSIFFQPLVALKKQFQLGVLNVAALILGIGVAWTANQLFGPLFAIISGITVQLFTGIIGSEILWQYHKKKLLTSVSSS